MSHDKFIFLLILAATAGLFLWGRWRHDLVALGSLLTCVLAGLLPPGDAFSGFGHPAVITVACVLILSRGLQDSGAVDALTRRFLPSSAGLTLTIAALTGLGALLSAFMNNVGALALLMPVAIQMAEKHKLPPGRILMPLAFGTILGGMTTLIGTPPNLIVSDFRSTTGPSTFGMFDYAPVGLVVALAGIGFLVLIGWRLVPSRKQAGAAGFNIGAYLTEVRIPEDSVWVGKALREFSRTLMESDAQVIGLIRNEFRLSIPDFNQLLRPGDILVIEADPESLASALAGLGLRLEEDVREKPGKRDDSGKEPDPGKANDQGRKKNGGGKKERTNHEDVALIELAVRPDAAVIGRSATSLDLRARHGINLLAFSRQGRHSIRRLRSESIRAGDVLLMQGPTGAVLEFAGNYGCVPLAPRPIRIPDKRRAITATLILAVAIAGVAIGKVPAEISFAAGALACAVFRVISPRAIYESVDWPVIVLLAALIPVAGVMASTGTAELIARMILDKVAQGNAIFSLAVILVATMTLSDFMNNAATAALMCPIAISTATQLAARPDSFLMAVAVGASCAFLTPIGHQNNTLILGPGGFRFGDYWRLGLPMEILIVLVGLPALLLFWPL